MGGEPHSYMTPSVWVCAASLLYVIQPCLLWRITGPAEATPSRGDRHGTYALHHPDPRRHPRGPARAAGPCALARRDPRRGLAVRYGSDVSAPTRGVLAHPV